MAKARASRATSATDIVFVGPTLPAHVAKEALPDAQIRGPVAVGEVLRLVDEHQAGGVRVGRIAIIDGYFERMAAVWHKEILLAIEAGIEVWGAASMGALRAAELAPFGMRGVGSIYERFASGELERDDEVAVAHLPAEFGYKPTSIALVDMREAIARGKMAAGDRARLLELARARFYRERTWDHLIADAQAARIAHNSIDALRSIAERTPRTRATLKATEAMMLLDALREHASVKRGSMKRGSMKRGSTKRGAATKLQVPRTWALAQLRVWLRANVRPNRSRRR